MFILRAMGRPCEYDADKALDRAMLVFWQKGYGATSISDLEEAMGMKRQSIYNAFGDKSELYARSIARYRQRAFEQTADLRKEGATVDDLKKTIQRSFEYARANECGGCMVVKTVFDQQVDDPEITKAAAQAAQDTRKLYEQVFVRAQQRGEIDPCADPAALSGFVFTIASGLSALAQTGGSDEDIGKSLDLAFAQLIPPGGATSPARRPRAR